MTFDQATPGVQRATEDQLRGVANGMGGLTDIWYGSPQEAHRVGALIDLMWQAIKPEQ
jgi:hypothetical protein